MKITRSQLRQIIKEELGRLNEDWTLNNEKEIDDAIASVKSDMKTPEGYEPGENERLLNRLTTAKKKGKYPVKIPARPTRS